MESCTFVNNPLCLSWNKTCDAPVSTIKSWGTGRALCAIKVSELGLGLGLRLGSAGLFQKVFPPKSLLGFRFAGRTLAFMVLSSCLSVPDAAILGRDAFGLGFPRRSKSLLGLPLRSPSGFGGQHSVWYCRPVPDPSELELVSSSSLELLGGFGSAVSEKVTPELGRDEIDARLN